MITILFAKTKHTHWTKWKKKTRDWDCGCRSFILRMAMAVTTTTAAAPATTFNYSRCIALWSEDNCRLFSCLVAEFYRFCLIITPIICDYYETVLAMEFFFSPLASQFQHSPKKNEFTNDDFSRQPYFAFFFLNFVWHEFHHINRSINTKTSHRKFL